jgi:hypothetical protein
VWSSFFLGKVELRVHGIAKKKETKVKWGVVGANSNGARVITESPLYATSPCIKITDFVFSEPMEEREFSTWVEWHPKRSLALGSSPLVLPLRREAQILESWTVSFFVAT